MRNLGYGSKPQAQAALAAAVVAAQADEPWRPGDPCMACGSTKTTLDDDGIPVCLDCHASDADET